MECTDISKSFRGVRALDGVNFRILPGTVHGLVGENGAGKSTLIKIISGAYQRDSGQIYLDGEEINVQNPEEMFKLGVATIYQDINLIQSMTVEENVFLNNEPKFRLGGYIRGKETWTRTAQLLDEFGIHARPNSLVADLPNDAKKMIQIAKAINRNAKILLMDEPTSSLTRTEERQILDAVRSLAARGVAVVFISHYLSEVFQVSDDITVLRNGKLVSTTATQDTDLKAVVRMMIGRSIDDHVATRKGNAKDNVVFSVNDLNVKGKLRSVSFDLHEGEVLGVTGLVGSGSSELAKALFGSVDVRKTGGTFTIDGRETMLGHPEQAVASGIAFVTDDRLNEGLLFGRPLFENVCLPTLRKFRTRGPFVSEKQMVAASDNYIRMLSIKTPDSLTPPQNLSGGNQQKVLVAKGLEIEPKVFILSEPTIGIDVGTKYEIRNLIGRMTTEGVSIVLVSTELEELEELCDRVLVMFRGEVVADLRGDDIRQETILEYSAGEGIESNDE